MLFGFANVLIVYGSRIEFHQRQSPFAGDGTGAKRLAAALHPQNDHAPCRIQPKLAGGVIPCAATLLQPVLQVLQSADGIHTLRGIHKLQHAGPLQQIFLRLEHVGDCLRSQSVTSHNGLGNRPLSLFLR